MSDTTVHIANEQVDGAIKGLGLTATVADGVWSLSVSRRGVTYMESGSDKRACLVALIETLKRLDRERAR